MCCQDGPVVRQVGRWFFFFCWFFHRLWILSTGGRGGSVRGNRGVGKGRATTLTRKRARTLGAPLVAANSAGAVSMGVISRVPRRSPRGTTAQRVFSLEVGARSPPLPGTP